MAINLANKYPGRANPESVDYPSGSFKNRTTPDSKDGMILEQSWANDFLGARDAILAEAGIVADGEVETAQKSQVLEALNKLYKALSTTNAPGIIQLATAAEAQALVNTAKSITPKTLDDAFKGSNQLLAGNGYQVYPGGLIVQWGTVLVPPNGTADRQLPISFSTTSVQVVAVYDNPEGANYPFVAARLLSASHIRAGAKDPSGAASEYLLRYIAIGR